MSISIGLQPFKMFGTYRTLLALAVVATHLLRVPSIGPHAVHAFFILSGYLMTVVMHQSYGYSLRGFTSFAINRSLRLFPTYWAILLIIISSGFWWGEYDLRSLNSAIYLPSSANEWIQNLTLIYPANIPMTVTPRLSPPTWALTVELLYYLLIALGISRHRNLALAWIGASLGYTIYTHWCGLGYASRYIHLAAGSLPFSIGALIFHYEQKIRAFILPFARVEFLIILGVMFVVNAMAAAIGKIFLQSESIQTICLYLNLPINFLLISVLLTKPTLPIKSSLDKVIGDFSYPIYLCHWHAGFLASMLMFGHTARGPTKEGILTFIIALVICGIISAFTINLVDRPVEKLRARVKSRLWRNDKGVGKITENLT